MSYKKIILQENTLLGVKGGSLYVRGSLGILKIDLKFPFSYYTDKLNLFFLSSFPYETFIKNAVFGSNLFYSKIIELSGLGFKVLTFSDGILSLRLGNSSVTKINVSRSLRLNILNKEGTKFEVKGVSKQQVGWFSARIKSLYPVEPYKARGVNIVGQYVFRKSGKKLS
jgi:hypothetical protein